MVPYRVFKQGPDGVLHYTASSQALGSGVREMDLIVDGHQLEAGDVVELDGSWLILREAGEYVYLPPCADSSFSFGDGCWCLQMKSRLQHEASVCEQMTEESQNTHKRR